MKIQPLAQGSGVPAHTEGTTGRSADGSKIARAKAIAAGQSVEQTQQINDHQAERAMQSIKKIKMRTNVSTNRHEAMPVEETDPTIVGGVEVSSPSDVAIPDTNEPPTQEAEEIKPLSPQFAALAKMKRAIQIERQQLEQEKAQLAQQAPNLDEYVSKADLLANPLKVFDLGLSYEDMTNAVLQNQSGQSIDVKTLREEIKAELKSELENQFSSRDQMAEQQVLAEYQREADALIQNNPDQYEAIRTMSANKLVTDLIKRTWKQTGEILDTQEAADLVENQLIEDYLPVAQLKKVQSRLTPQQEAQVAAQIPAPMPKPNTKVMKTLTNRDTAMPREDRRARALAAFAGTLKRG